MRHAAVAAAAAVALSACSTTRHTFADEEPRGIPKAARAHCRTEAEKLSQEHATDMDPAVRECVELKLRLDCAAAMLQRAEQLEKTGRGTATFFAKFPGAWDRDVLEDEVERMEEAETVCTAAVAAAAMKLFHGIRSAKGGRIPWPDRGWASPTNMNRCPECK